MRKRGIGLVIAGILAVVGAGIYNAQGRVPCVLEGIPQPCWVCNTCGVRPEPLGVFELEIKRNSDPEQEKSPVSPAPNNGQGGLSPAPTPSPVPSITPVRG